MARVLKPVAGAQVVCHNVDYRRSSNAAHETLPPLMVVHVAPMSELSTVTRRCTRPG